MTETVNIASHDLSNLRDKTYTLNEVNVHSIPGIDDYFELYLHKFHSVRHSQAYMVTGTFLPGDCSISDAWELIEVRLERIIQKFQNVNGILYILSSIEIHNDKQEEAAKNANTYPPVRYVFDVPDDLQKDEVKRVFSERDEKLQFNPHQSNAVIVDRTSKYIIPKLYQHYTANPKLSRDGVSYLQHISNDKNSLDPHPNIWPDAYRYLKEDGGGTIQTKSVSTLQGYPHLHLAVILNNQTNQPEKNGLISRVVDTRSKMEAYLHGVFIDLKCTRKPTKGRGKKPYQPTNDAEIIKYVLKNHAHKPTYKKLKRLPVKLHNISGSDDVKKFFHPLILSPYFVYIDNMPTVYQQVPVPAGELQIVPVPYRYQQIRNGRLHGHEKTTTNPFQAYAIKYMVANDLAVSDDDLIYEKVKGSKQTYAKKGTPEELYKIFLSSREEVAAMAKEHKQHYFELIKTGKAQAHYPYIYIDWLWIEFNDFFLHISSSTITQLPISSAAHAYYPDVTFEDIEKMKTGYNIPTRWLKIMMGYDNFYIPPKQEGQEGCLTSEGNRFLRQMYAKLMPKYDHIMPTAIYCENELDRENLIAPFLKMLPSDRLLDITLDKTIKTTQDILFLVVQEKHNTDPKRISNIQPYMEKKIVVGNGRKKKQIENRIHIVLTGSNPEQFFSNFLNKTPTECMLNWGFTIFVMTGRRMSNKPEALSMPDILDTRNPEDIAKVNAVTMKRLIEDEAGKILLFMALAFHENKIDIVTDEKDLEEITVAGREFRSLITDRINVVPNSAVIVRPNSIYIDPKQIINNVSQKIKKNILAITHHTTNSNADTGNKLSSNIDYNFEDQSTCYIEEIPDDFLPPTVIQAKQDRTTLPSITPEYPVRNDSTILAAGVTPMFQSTADTFLVPQTPPTPKLKPIINISKFKPIIVVDPTKPLPTITQIPVPVRIVINIPPKKLA